MGLSGWFGARSATGEGNGGSSTPGETDRKSQAADAQVTNQAETGAAAKKQTAAADISQNGGKGAGASKTALVTKAATPDVSALNQQVVQAVQFSNTETSNYADNLAITPPEIMVSQTAGMAVQDAKNYMNAIMQIAVAAQAVAIKKAAEGPQPVSTIKEIPFMEDIQNMVNQAVTVFGNVSTTAGTSAKTVISDLKSS